MEIRMLGQGVCVGGGGERKGYHCYVGKCPRNDDDNCPYCHKQTSNKNKTVSLN